MYSSQIQLFGWGACEDSQLGEIEGTEAASPRELTFPVSGKILRVACGYKHTLLLTTDGEVYSCGGNEYSQLGRNERSSRLGRISALENQTITDIACGAFHNAAISYTGRLFTWGCNSNGQLGREGDDCSVKMVRSLSEHRVAQVSLGLEHSLVLTDTARVFVFGSNLWGQLGLGFRSESPVPVPQQIMSLSGLPVRCICAGGMHSMVLTISGNLYSWGSDKYGQLGINTPESTENSAPSSPHRSSIEAIRYHCVSVPTYVQRLKGHRVVFVECGEAHTVVLTMDGRVFTFGGNQFGQLGHNNSSKSVAVPRQVVDLTDTSINQIACGRMHTLAKTCSTGRLYAFGAGSEGQLGNDLAEDSAQPVPIKGSWVGPTADSALSSPHPSDSFVITHTYAGGDHSIMLTLRSPIRDPGVVDDFRSWDPMSSRSVVTLCPEAIAHLKNSLTALPLPCPTRNSNSSLLSRSDCESYGNMNAQHSILRLEMAFSSLGCLAATCLTKNHFDVGRDEHGVDLDLARELQHQLFQHLHPSHLNRLISKLMEGVLEVSRPNYPGIECLRGFMVLSVSDLLNTPRKPVSSPSISEPCSRNDVVSSVAASADPTDNGPYPVMTAGFSNPGMILHAFASSINKLETAPSKIMDKWFAKMQPRYFKRLVVNLNNLIVYILNMRTTTADPQRKFKEEGIRSSLELMKRLYRVNQSSPAPISHYSFYIPEIKEKVNIDSAFVNWLKECESGGMRFFSFCDYPFVFDASTKARMLSVEATMSMQQAVNEAHQDAVLQSIMSPLLGRPFVTQSSPFFHVTVRRNALLQDTLSNLIAANPSDLRKVLRVKFEGEEAVDEGGVMKEFFMLIMRELLNPIYGMFRYYPESRMLWFNETTMESESVFQLVGILCGLAIYNSIIVDLSFPLAMFRKLLGHKPILDDLYELDPTVGRSLRHLLEYEGQDVAETFCLNFAITVDYFGENRQVELIENGSNVVVTHENKALYVESYVNYVFNRSCESQYRAFEHGFHLVCSGRTLNFFLPSELQVLVVGSEVVDWNELQTNTSYEGVFWKTHPVIDWFWDVFKNQFTEEDRKAFLRFLTGSDRVPVLGFSVLKIRIAPMNTGDDYLPVAHTCANLLDLPLYSSKEILAQKLSMAIQQTEGFGLV